MVITGAAAAVVTSAAWAPMKASTSPVTLASDVEEVDRGEPRDAMPENTSASALMVGGVGGDRQVGRPSSVRALAHVGADRPGGVGRRAAGGDSDAERRRPALTEAVVVRLPSASITAVPSPLPASVRVMIVVTAPAVGVCPRGRR